MEFLVNDFDQSSHLSMGTPTTDARPKAAGENLFLISYLHQSSCLQISMAFAGFNLTPIWRNDIYLAISPTKLTLPEEYVFANGASNGVGRATSIACTTGGVAGISIRARSDLSSVEKDLRDAAIALVRAVPKIRKISLNVPDKASIEDDAAKAKQSLWKIGCSRQRGRRHGELQPRS